ncbi:hypothetical protein, partial [Alkalihalophilus marmarensis]|uniref:hypothetical protein n=1 Tax=Alkalihalophilus marmarensis TaxID=521377 RepID=UPI002EB6D32F|nr:hypothetical protein [Alkalihalophilus marmarensis]
MARFRLLQKVIAQKVSEQQLLERTYSKTEIDHKDQGVYQDGTVYADQRSDQVKQEASEDATQKAGQAKDEAKAHADDKAHQAEENAKDYTDFVDQNVRQYTDAEILATEIALLQELADKAGLEYVNGQLQLKANQNDFNFLSADVDTHNSKIGSLQDMASNLQGEINAIEGELVTLRSTVNDDISSLQSAASSLLQRANEQESALASASGRIVTVEENIDTINGTMSTTINELTSINGIVSEHQTTI